MSHPSPRQSLTRRQALLATAAGLAGAGVTPSTAAQASSGPRGTVRDKLWVFNCATNSDFPHIGRRSVMSPAEGAFYLGVPNIIMVQSSPWEAKYGRLEPPFAQYMFALQPLKQVVWSAVGSAGFHTPAETKEVLELARTTPNMTGVMLDDFFTDGKDGKRAQWSVEELAEFRRQLQAIGKKQEIFATFYTKALDRDLRDYLALIDVVTFWTWKPAELANLDTNLAKLEKVVPKAKKMLGCYLVDYSNKAGVPLPAMKHQCQCGLRWLREGRIEGMIFLGNTVMDVGFESVEWTRNWIREVGDTKL